MGKYRKFLTALAGAVATIVSANALPPEYQNYGVALLTLLTALGVYQVRNDVPLGLSD